MTVHAAPLQRQQQRQKLQRGRILDVTTEMLKLLIHA